MIPANEYPTEAEMEREFLRWEGEPVPLLGESKGSPWKVCPWCYPEYQHLVAEVAEEGE